MHRINYVHNSDPEYPEKDKACLYSVFKAVCDVLESCTTKKVKIQGVHEM